MAIERQEKKTEVDSRPSRQKTDKVTLTEAEYRTVAEIIYTLIKEELRIERERLGR